MSKNVEENKKDVKKMSINVKKCQTCQKKNVKKC